LYYKGQWLSELTDKNNAPGKFTIGRDASFPDAGLQFDSKRKLHIASLTMYTVWLYALIELCNVYQMERNTDKIGLSYRISVGEKGIESVSVPRSMRVNVRYYISFGVPDSGPENNPQFIFIKIFAPMYAVWKLNTERNRYPGLKVFRVKEGAIKVRPTEYLNASLKAYVRHWSVEQFDVAKKLFSVTTLSPEAESKWEAWPVNTERDAFPIYVLNQN
jgi:hypothetical protein